MASLHHVNSDPGSASALPTNATPAHLDPAPLPLLLLRSVVAIICRLKNPADLEVLLSDPTFLASLALWLQDPKPNSLSMYAH